MNLDKRYMSSLYNIGIKLPNNTRLLYNSLSGALSYLDEFESNVFMKASSSNMKEEIIIDKLLAYNFLVPTDIKEVEYVKKLYNKLRFSNNNLSLTILPTLDCNFNCHYCFQSKIKDSDIMSEDTMKSIIRLIDDKCKKTNKVFITWFGGEPLIGYKKIKEISDKIIPYFDSKNIYYESTLVTNGYMLTYEYITDLYLRKVKKIQITLDGTENIHNKNRYLKDTKEGSFDKIIHNITTYIDKFPIITIIRINISNQNKSEISSLIKYLSEIGLGFKNNFSIYFAPIDSPVHGHRNLADVVLNKKEYAKIEYELFVLACEKGLCTPSLPYRMAGLCGATSPNGYVIVPNGAIHKCWETVSFDENKIGSLKNDGTIFSNETLEEWDNWTPFQNERCLECNMLPNCVGFCAYRSRNINYPLEQICPSLKYNIKNKLLFLANYKKLF